MLVEHHYPEVVYPFELDNYLSEGWFRSSNSMFRSEILCFEQEIHSVINVRIPLSNFRLKKRLRRICRNVNNRFKVTVQPLEISPEKDALYHAHKYRFKGYLQDNLFSYLNGEEHTQDDIPVFTTYEVNVFDGDKLIAFSLFDVGETAIASILGVFDINYEKYSLGTFTMLREIEFAQSLAYAHYYPGYVLSETDLFDYKLRLSNNVEFYSQDKEWRPIEERSDSVLTSDFLKEKIAEVKMIAELLEFPCQVITYPAFSLAYLNYNDFYFVRTPIFILLFNEEIENDVLIIEYWMETDEYVISEIEIASNFLQQQKIKASESELSSKTNCMDLLNYNSILVRESHPTDMMYQFIEQIKALQSK